MQRKTFPENLEMEKETAIQMPQSTTQWSLSWENLSYVVGKHKNEKSVLENMNGVLRQGQMTAIMGGSGAGKSSLLNCISGRLSGGRLCGSILLNGKPRDEKSWKKTVCFVEQDDLVSFKIQLTDVYQLDCF